MNQKSKNDLERQIQRIFRTYGSNNPRYKKALGLVLRYNNNMSKAKTNNALWEIYRSCHYFGSGNIKNGMEERAAWALDAMGKVKYPKSVYAIK